MTLSLSKKHIFIGLFAAAALFLAVFVFASQFNQSLAQEAESKSVLDCNGQAACTIEYGGQATINWSAPDYKDCTVTSTPGGDAWSGLFGSELTGALSETTEYLLTCDDKSISSVIVTVNAQNPTGSITCGEQGEGKDCNIPYNTEVLIVWSSENAESCIVEATPGNGFWEGTSGKEYSGLLTITTTYELQCSPPPNGARIPIQSVTVNVEPSDYTLSCNPVTANVAQGGTTSYTLIAEVGDSFNGDIVFNNPTINPDNKNFTKPTHAWAPGLYPEEMEVSNISTDGSTTVHDSYEIVYSVDITESGTTVKETCTVYVNVTSTPTGGITCDGAEDCPIAYNSTANISWTSVNAESCTVTASQGGDLWTGLTGSETTSNLTTTTTYTLECAPPPNGARIPIDSVTVTVGSDFAVNCSPVSQTINAGSDASFIIQSTGLNGFQNKITIDGSITHPYTMNVPAVTYTPGESQAVPDETTATISTEENTTPGTYSIIFTGYYDGGGTGSPLTHDCAQVELTVIGAPPVPPENVAVDNQEQCGAIDISWTRGAGTNPEGYRVYRTNDADQGGATWTQIGGDIPYGDVAYTSDGINYTYRDNNPLESGSNYYTVVAYNYGIQSEYDSDPSGIIPIDCTADISLSDIDVLSVIGNISKTFTPSACSGQSEVASLPNNGLFSQGDLIEFQMNICSSGELDITNPIVNLTVSNLSNLKVTEITPGDCIRTDLYEDKPGIVFNLNDLIRVKDEAIVACSIKFTATIETSASTSNQMRFQAVANITADQANAQIYSPPYLVGRAVGTPQRGEVAP